MLPGLFLAGSVLLGSCLARRILGAFLNLVEQLLWGAVIGCVLPTIAIFWLARWQGQLTYKLILAATVVIWIVAALMIVFQLRRSNRTASLFVWQRHYVGLALVLTVLAPVYFALLSHQVFPHREGGIY